MGRWLAVAAGMIALSACGGSTDIGGADGGAAYNACTRNDDCIVRPASCCGACGAATRGDVIAVNKDRATAYANDHCSGVGCPACFAEQDATLIATCESNRCTVVDLLADSSTGCTADSDCRVRTSSCCECGGALDRAHLVAVGNEAAFSSLVCDGQGCPDCAPIYPAEVRASCNADQHCEPIWQTP